MRALANTALFLLTVLEMTLGIIAGSIALASLITETVARATAMRRRHVRPALPPDAGLPRLRTELATVLSGIANPAAGGTR